MKNVIQALVFLLLPAWVSGQTGREFWVAPPDVTYLHNQPGDQPIYFNVTAGNTAAVVTIAQPANPGFNGGSPIVLNVPANSSVRYNMTSLKTQLETRPTNTVCNTGLHITATEDITCYYESSNTNNPDIIALKGANGLGTEFYIPLHKHPPFHNHDFGNNSNKAFASFDIVATEDNTTVLINSPVDVDGHPGLTPFMITLNRGQTYSCANTLYATYTDPTKHPSGAAVLSDKPIAITIKDDSNHNPSGGCYDLMMDQIVPVNILGTDYVAVKGSLYNTGDESVFLMAVENNTKIYINGNPAPVATLFAGQYYRHDMDYLSGATDNATYMSASKPVYAIHVTGFGCEMGMAILPPLNCAGSQQVGITRSTNEGFFLNLLVRSGSENDFVVTGPGTATIPGSAFRVVPGTGGAWMAAHIQYNTTQVPVNQGLVITNTSDVFSLGVINGGAGSGCRYGFFSEFSGKIEVDAGTDQTLCAGESASLTGTVSGGSTTGIWTTTGSGTFQPSATSLNATYEPSIGDIALGGVTLRLTSTGPCMPEFDEMTLTLQPKPITDAGPDQQVCTSAPTVTLAGSVLNAVGGVWTGGTNPFLPANSNLNATYTPTPAEVASGSMWIYLTSTGNGVCSAVKDSLLVTFTPAPTVDAGPDQTLCANNPVAPLNGSITVATGGIWSGGAGTFDPSTTNLHATYTPTATEIANGSVTLTLTTTGNGNCVVVSDQVQLNFTTAPTANAGTNSSVCANNADIALNGSVTVATGGIWSGGTGTYSPANAPIATYTPTATEIANGSVTLTLTTTGNGNCLAATSSRTISFTPAPIVDAGTNGTVCANNAAISLNGSVIGASGGTWSGGTGTYSPNANSPTASYTPSAAEITAGTVTLTLTSTGNGTCNPVTDQVTYTITPAPTANAGANQTLCANNAVANLNGSFTGATGGVWSGGAGSFDPSTTNMAVTYTPTATEIANGSVTLMLTTTGNGNCNAVSDPVTINYTAAPSVYAGANSSVCANNAAIALNGIVSGASGGVWSGGAGSYNPGNTTPTATYTPTASEIAAGSVTLTLTSTGNGNCNAVSSSRTITFTPAPIVDAGTNSSVCANAPAMSLNGSILGATGGIWSGGAGTFNPNNTTLNATYTPTAAEISAGTVTLTLTSAGNGNCNAVSDQVTWTITPAPTVNAGLDRTVCGNNAAVTLNGSFTVATGGIWTGGTGSFDPSTTNMNASYTPSAAEVAAGFATLTLTTTGNGLCNAVSDQMTITLTPAPTANAGANSSVCANNAAIALNGSVTVATGGIWSGGTGVFTPDNAHLITSYMPTAAEIAAGQVTLTLTTTGNGTCLPATSSRTITFTPAPVVNAGVDASVCANAPAMSLNGSILGATGGIWSGGAGTFNPNNTTLTATYTPTAAEITAGTVTLTLTSAGNGNCNAVSDQVTWTITPAPTVSAGPDQNICSNNAVATLAGSYTVASGAVWSGGAGTYSPGNTSVNATYTPTAAEVTAGFVTLTLTTTGNGLCNAVSDQMTLHFTAAPTANAGADVTRCANNANVVLGGSVAGATGGIWSGGAGSYTPNNTDLNATYAPTPAEINAGILTLTLTTTGNGNCLAVTDQKTISFSPAPVVDAGTNGTVCANMPGISLNGSVTGATGGTWSGGSGTYSPNANDLNATYTPSAAERTAGVVTLTLTSTGNGLCNPVSDQVTYTITPAPTVNAGADQDICSNNATATLNGSFTLATGVVWSGGAGTYSPSATSPTATYTPTATEIANGSVTLTLTTTGNNNCMAVTDQVTLNFTPAPTVNAGADASVCVNNANVSLNGSVTVASGGVWSGGAGSFTPNNTDLNATYTPTPSELAGGTLTLTLTSTGNGNCSAVSDSKVITFTPAPVVDAGTNGTVCANAPAMSLNGSVSGATGGVWSGGNGTYNPNNFTLNAVYTPTAAERTAGTVTLTLTSAGNGSCNAVSDQVTWTITPAPTVNAGPDQSLCSNNPVATLAGSFTVATGAVWSGGAGSFSPDTNTLNATYTPTASEVANGSVTLTLTTTGNNNCVAVSDQVTLNFTPAPVANAGADVSVCANNAGVALGGSVSVATGGIWSGGLGSYTPNNTDLNATYAPTPAEINAGILTLTLTTTGNGNCLAVTDQKTISFTPAPVVDAGANGTVCANLPAIPLNGSVTGAGGGTWTGAGTFSPNANTLNATYTPTVAERNAGTVTLTLTSTSNGNCNAVSDQVTWSITPAPTVNAGADQNICANNPAATLNGSFTLASGVIWTGGAGTFSPGATSPTATYTPTAAEIASGSLTLTLSTTGNNNCLAVSDQMTLHFTPAPVVNAGADVTLCVNNANVALNGSVSGATGGVWSGGAGSFTPNNTTLNATYTPTPAELAGGTLTLTLTSTGFGNCIAVSDSKVITFTPAPVVDAGTNGTVCANNATITLNGSVTGAGGGIWSGGNGTYNPNNTTLNATYTPTAAERAAGTVTLTLTSAGNGNCSAVSDQVTYTITPAPTVNAGADQSLCANNPVATLAGSFTVASGVVWSGGAGAFNPSATNANATYTPDASEIANGSVTLTLTTTGNNNCVAVSDQVTLNFTPAPTVNAGADVSLCRNNADVALNGSVTVASGGIWSGGAGSYTPNNTTLNATYTPTAAELAAGTLTLTLTSTGNGNCGVVSDSKVITFTPAPTVDAGLNGTVCANNAAITLNGTVNGATGGIWSGGTGTYNPNSGTLNAVYTPSAAERTAGSVTLTLTTVGNGNCSAVSDQVTYTITPAPTANAGADRSLCANNPDVTLSGAFTVATGGIWSGGNGTYNPGANNMSAVYTPTAAEIANGTVTLTLTTTGNGLCNAATDQVVLTFTDAPSANAGPDVTVCANNAAVALNGSVMIATGGTWSGGAGIFSPNANTLNATYTPSAADIAAGMVALTLTTTGNGTCTPATDTRIITYTPAPIVNAGADGTVCANNAAISLNGTVTGATGGVWSGGNGSFSPNSITLNATYTPTAAEIAAGTVTLTLTSAGNGLCNAVSDQVTFTITPAPTVNAGADQSLCGNNANAVLNAAITVATGVQWSGGTGLYSPGSTAQNITYTPSAIEIANGSVTLTATTTGNSNCAAVSDNVTLTFTPAPLANAGPDQSVSANNAATTLAGSYTIATGMVWSGGAGTYNPDNTTPNAVYTPTAAEIAAGSVTLTLTTTGNGACAASSDQMTITFTDAPTADAGPDQTICANNASVVLSGSVTIATGGIWSGGTGTYNPGATSLNTTYFPSAAEIAAGTVTLTLTTVGNGNSNPVSDQVTITITPAPVVNAGANLATCANQPTAQLAGVVTNATGGVWSGGSGTFNPSANNLNATYTPTLGEIAAGTVTLTLTSTGNGLCNAVSDQVVITIAPAPVVNAGVDQTVCSNNANVQLAGSVTHAAGGIWSGGTGGFSPSINALNAVYTPSATELANGSVTLTLTSTGNGSCVAESDAMTIYFSQSPVVNAGADRTVCANDPTVVLNGSVTIAGGGVWSGGTGTWTPNANTLNATYHPSPAEVALGTATLTLTSTQNGLCNAVSDQMTITIIASPVANAGNDISVCSNNATVQLGASVTGAGGGQWSGGAGTFTPSIADLNAVYTPTAAEIAAGTLTLTLTTIGNGNCVPVSDNVQITFTAPPTANAGTDGVYCANNAAIALNGSVTVANGGAWSGGGGTFAPDANALNAVYTPSQGEIAAGFATLTLTTTGNNGCTAVSDQVTYTFTPAPTANAGADASICANNATVQLNGAITVATGALWSGGNGTYSPNNSALNAVYAPTAAEIATGTVTLTLTTVGNGLCNAVSDQMTVTITPAPVVDAGQPLQSCANNPSVQLAGSVQNATGGTWSGAGTFSDPNSLSAIYTPSAAEVLAGTATITLTSAGNGLCNAVSDQVTITITDAPVVDAGAAQTLCANNVAAQLAGSVANATGGAWSGGAGSFSPNANTLNAVYTASAAEVAAGSVWLYLTSTGNGGCLASRDSVLLTFTPAPVVNAGLDAHVCANDADVQLAGSVTVASGGIWSGGAGSFAPNAQDLNAVYTPSALEIAAGQINLVLTSTGNGNCTAVKDSLTITVDPVPVVNAGPDQNICANNPVFQLNGFVGNAPGGQWSGGAGNYFPSNTSLAVQYTPTAAEIAAGSVTFTLTSTGTVYCNAVTDQMTVYFTDSPVVNAGVDQSICANNPAVQLNGDVLNANGGAWTGGSGSFSPSASVLSPVYTPTAAELASGSLNLYLTSTGNGNCIAVRDTIQLTFTPAPTVNAGTDLNVCYNNPTVNLNGASTVAGGVQWSGGLGSYSPDAQNPAAQYTLTPFELQSGSVTLTLTTTGNGNCLAVTDQMTINVTPAPEVNAGADITTCSNSLQVPLTGTVQAGATIGMWSTSGTGTFFPSATDLNATYMASALDSLNGTVDLTLTATNYGLCNAVSDVMTLTILPNAVANAGPDQSICASAATVQLAGSITGNATQGHWTSTGAGSFTPNADDANAVYQLAPGDAALGTLTFTWSVNSCDNAADQMVLTIVPVSTVNAGADQTVCFGSLNVVVNGQVGGASNTGVWSTLGSGSFANPADALSNVYQASAQDSIAQGVDLVLMATNTGSCAAAADTLHIAILPAGTVSAGVDQTFCANNANVQLAGTLSGDATQVQWSTSGTGSFYPSSTVLTPTYVPSAIDTAIGSLTLTLSAVNTCNNASDAMTLTLTPAPYVNAGPDQTYCDQVSVFPLSGTISGITNVGQWTTTGTGTIANAGSLNTTYTASAADIAAGQITFTLTSLNNGNCGPVSDNMTIFLTDGIIVSAGPDQSVCVASDHANLQGTITNGSPSGTWTTTGTGTFQPSADVLNAQYYFSPADVANGAVVLTFTATNTGTCPSGSDQMTLTFGNTSYAYAGADQSLCANAPIAQLAGNFSGGATGVQWTTSGSGTFSNTTNPAATYTLSSADIAAGAVTLTMTTITSGSCAAASDQVLLTVNALPNITAGGDVIACTAGPVQLAANVANASGGSWSTSGTGTFFDANALATLYYPSAADSIAGSVTLTVTSTGMAPCSAVSDALTISFGGGYTAQAGNDVITCSTSPNVALSGTVSGTTTGVWTTSGTGSFSPSATDLNATYIPGAADFVIGNINLVLSTTNNQGCPAGRDTLVVSYHVPPTVNAGADHLLCFGVQPVQLNATAQNDSLVHWVTTGTGSFSPDANSLNAVYTPSANDSIQGGVYLILTAYGSGTCGNASDSLYIGVGPTRIANAGADLDVCADGGPIQLGGTITGVSGGTWTTNGSGSFVPDASALNATYVPSAPDLLFGQLSFTLSTTGNMGCPAHSDTMLVSLHQPSTVHAGSDITTCDASAQVQLAGTFTGAPGVQWSTTGTGTFMPDNTTPDAIYQPSAADSVLQQVFLVLTTTGDPYCAAATDSLTLSFVNPLTPAFSVGQACAGSQTQFTDASTSTGPPIIGWNWDFGNGATASGQQAGHAFPGVGQYPVVLTVYAQNGCSATISQTVEVMDAPLAGFGFEGETRTGESISFLDQSSGGSGWHYDFGDGHGSLEQNPAHTYTGGGQYIVVQTVSNAAGCTASDSLLIVITEDKVVPPKLPDAFSPNGDGVNDVFYVRGGPFKELHLRIYNGWGEMVFETFDPEFGWDGTHNGKPEINGVYVYTVEAVAEDGRGHSGSGKVTLVR
ncbi:MAG: gliding motility-associated C-terminal domain-containing protein [Flavobacteriia bacterium]|nr:gliding motility-associated C-terminal domain-containing protein [Flavobacteriia bacterium]